MAFFAALAPFLTKAGIAGAKFGTGAAKVGATAAKAAGPVAKGVSTGGGNALSALFAGGKLGGAGFSLGNAATAGGGGGFMSSLSNIMGNPLTKNAFSSLGNLGQEPEIPDYVQNYYNSAPFQGVNNVPVSMDTTNPYLMSPASLPGQQRGMY